MSMDPVTIIRKVAGMAQTELAEIAGTSQPTISAYESGTKSPSWQTVQRLAQAEGLVCLPFVGRPLTRDQVRSLYLHQRICELLHDNPMEIIGHAKKNLHKMKQINAHATKLFDRWEEILDDDVVAICSHILDPTPLGCDLRQVSPFAGLITNQGRTKIYRQFRKEQDAITRI